MSGSPAAAAGVPAGVTATFRSARPFSFVTKHV